MSSRILRLPANLTGRDFVVGDIHGAFHLLVAALDRVGFDPARDRLFSTGDLVDRGPYSAEALKFLREPWVFAVPGNHERMIVDMYANRETPDEDMLAWNVIRNGMAWWLEITPEQRSDLLDAFAALPYVIEVETSRGRVGLLHAEVPRGMDWTTFLREVEADNPTVLESLFWGRERDKHDDTSGVPGIDRIFAGHTVQERGVRQLGNVFILDTGAVFGNAKDPENACRLTMANLISATRSVLAPQPQLTLVDIRDVPSTTPFGCYAMGAPFALAG